MRRILAAAMFVLLTFTAPARAAYLQTLDPDLNLQFSGGYQLTGELALDHSTPYEIAHMFPPYAVTFEDLTLNGAPLEN